MAEVVQQYGYNHTAFPQQLVVEVTAGCNQRCIFCGRTYMDRPKKTMHRQMFEKIADEVSRENPYTEIWPAFMGESMLLGDKLFQMIAYAKNIGCRKITLNTNGTRINEKTVPGILQSGIDRLIVSCDAHTPETHEIVRPGTGRASGGLLGIYRGVELLIETMRERNVRRPVIEMQFSIFDENEHEVKLFRKFWIDKGVVVKVRPKVYWSGTVSGGNHRVDLLNRVPCLWAMDTAAIHWNGNIVMCAIDCDGKYVAGNVEMQTIREVWNGPLRWIRELHLRHRFSELPEICRKCPDWNVKKAHAYFPDDVAKKEYEDYVRMGRSFMEEHFWDEERHA